MNKNLKKDASKFTTKNTKKKIDKPLSRDKKDNNNKHSSKGQDKTSVFDKKANKVNSKQQRNEYSKEAGKKYKDRDNFFDKKQEKNHDNYQKSLKIKEKTSTDAKSSLVRLNKFIANTGICSRREADELIVSGAITVNGKVVTELGTKIDPNKDKVQYGGQRLTGEKKVYILLNKPKNYLTTTKDPNNRRTVMELIKDACKERVFPVGRLDRTTMGLLLFTNDGELADKLMHPRANIKKIYHVTLDKKLTKNDLIKIREGLTLDDGPIKVDAIDYVQGVENHKEVGVEIHSGRNRIIRRIFEHLGYNVVKLDRVFYAGLTKKDLPRGKYRKLTQMEVNMLKML